MSATGAYREGDDLKYEVVVAANEDVTGVHEVLWSANTWWPEKAASDRLRLAEVALEWALARGFITLHYDDSDDARALAPREYAEVLKEWRTWAIPEGPVLYFRRTAEGERWLSEKPTPRSWARRAWLGVDERSGDIDFPDLT